MRPRRVDSPRRRPERALISQMGSEGGRDAEGDYAGAVELDMGAARGTFVTEAALVMADMVPDVGAAVESLGTCRNLGAWGHCSTLRGWRAATVGEEGALVGLAAGAPSCSLMAVSSLGDNGALPHGREGRGFADWTNMGEEVVVDVPWHRWRSGR